MHLIYIYIYSLINCVNYNKNKFYSYISKFMIQSIDFHSFFSESLFTMDPVNDSSFSITSQSGELTSSQTLVSDSAIRYVIQQIEYRGI